MGEIEIAGADALKAVQHITSNDASRLADGQIQYSALTTPQGTFVDDVLTYRLADDHFMLVVNASNIVKDFHWIAEHVKEVGGDAVAVNTSSRYALLALQGPAAKDVLQTLTGVDLSAIKYYWFATGEVAGVRVTISRTGYTGEDGFEVFVAAERRRARLGRDPAGRARAPGSSRPGSARATRCASRRRCASTATTWTTRPPWSKPISTGSSAGRRSRSSGPTS